MGITVSAVLTLLFIAFLTPIPAHAYFRLTAQTTPYLVLPKTRPQLRSSSVPAKWSSSAAATGEMQKIRTGVLDLVNKERAARKLTPLKTSAMLTQSAQKHAEDMLKRNFFSHLSPEGSTPEKRIEATGYFKPPCVCSYKFSYGENIAKGQPTPADVMKAWMNSKVHRDNILKPEFRELGVGYSSGVWVQNFGAVAITGQ